MENINDMYNKNQGAETKTEAVVKDTFTTGGSSITFSGMTGIHGGAEASNIATKLEDIFNSKKSGYEISIFEKDIYRTSYSMIAVSKRTKKGTRLFVTLLLADTGSTPLSVEQFTNIAINEDEINLFTLDAMFDDVTIETVINDITRDGEEPHEAAGYIIRDYTDDKILSIASVVNSIITSNEEFETKNDLILDVALKEDSNNANSLDLSYRHVRDGVITDDLGNVVRADFEVTLNMTPTIKRRGNSGGGQTALIRVAGYVDYEFIDVPDRYNDRKTRRKAAPHIIITNIKTLKDTPNFGLLAIVISTVMSNETMLLGHMLNTKDKVAQLNREVNVNEDKNPKPLPVDKLSDEVLISILQDMVLLEPAFSLDIEHGGSMEGLIPFLSGVESNDLSIFYNSARTLSNGRYTDTEIPAVECLTPIPKVIYHNNGDRDARDWDMATILAEAKDLDKAYQYSRLNSGGDTFTKYVVMLSDLNVDGPVVSTISRIGINAEFITGLYRALGISNKIKFNDLHVPMSNKRSYSDARGSRAHGSFFSRQTYGGNTRAPSTYKSGRRY